MRIENFEIGTFIQGSLDDSLIFKKEFSTISKFDISGIICYFVITKDNVVLKLKSGNTEVF